MTLGTVVSTLRVRPYRDEDQEEVLALLVAALGQGPAGRRSAEFFRWKHLDNPFGRSFMIVGESDGRIIGFRAFLRWRFDVDGRSVRAVRPVDTATHPDHQGRGIFSRLTREALEMLSDEADVVFNTPNAKSLPGYLKMGWKPVGRIPIGVRSRRPLSSLRGLRRTSPIGPRPTAGAPEARTIEELPGMPELLRAAERPAGRLATPGSSAYLSWRYGRAPLLDYRVVRVTANGRLQGVGFLRVRPRKGLWETTIADILVSPGDVSVGRRLLSRAARVASADVVTCSFPAGSTARRAARRAGFVRAPRGILMIMRPLREALDLEPHDLSSWGLRLGDVEVF